MSYASTPTVLVTGANRGLGFDVVKRFLRSGATVLMTCRNLQDGQAAAGILEEELGQGAVSRLTVLELDQSKDDSIQRLAELIREKYAGKIDVLVNNAGTIAPGWTQDIFDHVVGTNVWGVVKLVDALLPLLPDGASIVNVSSDVGRLAFLKGEYATAVPNISSMQELHRIGFLPESEQRGVTLLVDTAEDGTQTVRFDPRGACAPAYCLSKAMLNRYVQLFAKDTRTTSRSIRVNAVCPGWCATRMGSDKATRTVEQGGRSVYLAATSNNGTGTFTRDGAPVSW